jgi:hypothetical protein
MGQGFILRRCNGLSRKAYRKFACRNAILYFDPPKNPQALGGSSLHDYRQLYRDGSYAEPPTLSVMARMSSIGKGKMIVEFFS